MSTSIDERLQALGIELPQAPAPAGVYVPAVVAGDVVYTAGQLPLIDGALPATGRVGECDDDGGAPCVTPERAAELARVAALNALGAIRAAVGDLDRVERIVKVVGFVASHPSFTGQPLVLNGASEVLGEIFGDAGVHARSAVGVAALPLGAPVEVELIAQIR